MTLVFTNGCFDLAHNGHVRLLQFARSLGDELVVGVNSDASVQRLKGLGRPIVRCELRMEMLAALRCVDRVIEFDELTPLRLIRDMRPDVLVKGRGYDEGQIVGGDLVRTWGGRVVAFDSGLDLSTTRLLERLICT